jgi:hypothetical protein
MSISINFELFDGGSIAISQFVVYFSARTTTNGKNGMG